MTKFALRAVIAALGLWLATLLVSGLAITTPLTLLLAPTGFSTLASNVWTYTEEAQYAAAAPYALVIAASGALLTILILRRDK